MFFLIVIIWLKYGVFLKTMSGTLFWGRFVHLGWHNTRDVIANSWQLYTTPRSAAKATLTVCFSDASTSWKLSVREVYVEKSLFTTIDIFLFFFSGAWVRLVTDIWHCISRLVSWTGTPNKWCTSNPSLSPSSLLIRRETAPGSCPSTPPPKNQRSLFPSIFALFTLCGVTVVFLRY